MKQSITRLLLALVALAVGPASTKAGTMNAVVIQADFGGVVMMGVCYTVSKDLAIFRVQPLIPRHDIDAAARSLRYNSQVWPEGTAFVSVVDPGVGTSRKSVVLKTKNGFYFVSPDNGTLALVAKEYGIDPARLGKRNGSPVIHRLPESIQHAPEQILRTGNSRGRSDILNPIPARDTRQRGQRHQQRMILPKTDYFGQ